jgi:hypothetical protein
MNPSAGIARSVEWLRANDLGSVLGRSGFSGRHNVQTCSGAHPVGSGVLSSGVRQQGLLAGHSSPSLVPRLIMCGTLPPSPICFYGVVLNYATGTTLPCTETTSTFHTYSFISFLRSVSFRVSYDQTYILVTSRFRSWCWKRRMQDFISEGAEKSRKFCCRFTNQLLCWCLHRAGWILLVFQT